MMSKVITASLDQDSATSGIQEAIDALGERGGSVRIPAGKWRLRQSIVLRSGVSLIGDGPATELTIAAPRCTKIPDSRCTQRFPQHLLAGASALRSRRWRRVDRPSSPMVGWNPRAGEVGKGQPRSLE